MFRCNNKKELKCTRKLTSGIINVYYAATSVKLIGNFLHLIFVIKGAANIQHMYIHNCINAVEQHQWQQVRTQYEQTNRQKKR